jgi:hypothetical protein
MTIAELELLDRPGPYSARLESKLANRHRVNRWFVSVRLTTGELERLPSTPSGTFTANSWSSISRKRIYPATVVS